MASPPLFVQGIRDKREIPVTEVKIPAPGPKREKPEISPISFLLPVGLTVIGLVVMIALSTSGGGQALLTSMLISVPMMIGSYVVSYLNYRNSKSKYERETAERESKYRARLGQHRQELTLLRDQTQAASIYNAPDSGQCMSIVESRDQKRMWARQPYHEDFLDLRVGLGEVPFHIKVESPEHPSATEHDPLIEEARMLAAEFKTIHGVPVTLPLREAGIVGVCGPRADVLSTIRSLVIQIASHHSPLDVKLIVIYPEQEAQEWKWMGWLPHTWDNEHEQRFMACGQQQAHDLLARIQGTLLKQREEQVDQQTTTTRLEPLRPSYVFLLSDPRLVEGQPVLKTLLTKAVKLQAYSVFCADDRALPPYCRAWVEINRVKGIVHNEANSSNKRSFSFQADTLTVSSAELLSRCMAPVRIQASDRGAEIPSVVPLLDIFNVQTVEQLDILERWQSNDPNVTMSVPVGRRAGGKLQYWDVQAPRDEISTLDQWHGPHALVAGKTRSGKSELLHSLLLSLAVNIDPRQVSFVLLDFKTPGLVDDIIRQLPHTISTITDLQIRLVPRALESLEHELKRREALFAQAVTLSGQPVSDLHTYNALYHKGIVKTKLPYLILIVDEFTRLKQTLPDALERFVTIAIVGGAFGFRMILAAQKPQGVVTGQIEANTQLRACLQVAQVEDSREVVGDDEAAYFTRAGRVHWRWGQQKAETYQSAYPGAVYEPTSQSDPEREVQLFFVGENGERHSPYPPSKKTPKQEAITQYQVLVDYIQQTAKRAGIERLPGIWLEPLPEAISLSTFSAADGWDGSNWIPGGRWLCPLVGLLDDPGNQLQPELVIDLARHGHLYVCSGTGASTRLALRTLVERLACDHSPEELNFYLLDFGNAGLKIFEPLPHTGAVISKKESSRIHRLLRWLKTEMDHRRQWLDTQHYDSLAKYRASGNAGSQLPALIVVIDDLGVLKDQEDAISILDELTVHGQAVGIHLIISSNPGTQASSLYKILNNVKSLRLALELDGPQEYRDVVDTYPTSLVMPKGIAGRGIYKAERVLECQLASPSPDKQLLTLSQTMREASSQRNFREPQRIRELPAQLSLDDLLPGQILSCWASQHITSPVHAPLGLDDTTMEAFQVNLEMDGPHFLITGRHGGGKTTTLYTWVLALAEMYPKDIVQFVLIDTMAGSLATLKDLPHVTHYGVSVNEHQAILQYLRQILDDRETAGRQNPRPLIVVIADDYQFLKLSSSAVVEVLKDQALRGVLWGLHIVLSGESGQISKWEDLPKQVLYGKSGLFVGSNDLSNDGDVFDLPLIGPESKQKLPRGRGYFVIHKTPRLVQIATPGDEQDIQKRIQRIITADRTWCEKSET